MKIRIYDENNNYYEIQTIEYTQFNRKDTVIDYLKSDNNEIYTVRYEGWLSIQEIINKIIDIYV